MRRADFAPSVYMSLAELNQSISQNQQSQPLNCNAFTKQVYKAEVDAASNCLTLHKTCQLLR